MSTYVISDIHGEYDMFLRLLEKIKFFERDTLYVLGDVLDRGLHPIKVLLEMMKYPNILPVVGNHEVMGISGLRFLMKEITEENIEAMDEDGMQNLLVHAGLANFHPYRLPEDYTLHELVWERPDYGQAYFEDIYIVTGHTPTQCIEVNPRPGRIYRANNHIAIDCGACFGGSLAAICLETGEEFYVEGT